MEKFKTFDKFAITESVNDIQKDINDYEINFKTFIKNHTWVSNWLESDELQETEQGIYMIGEMDMDGRYVVEELGLFKAMNEKHAEIRASLLFNNPEIFGTGFYHASKMNQSEINKKIKEAQKKNRYV